MKVPVLLVLMLVLGIPLYAGGKAAFIQSCHSCHQQNNMTIAPIDKASSQWKRFFKRKKHQRKTKIPLTDQLNPKDLNLILNYLIDHAADSDQPEVAGSL